MSKRFWAILAVIIVIFVGILLAKNHKTNAPGSGGKATVTNHVEGKGQSGVTLVEYGDYECPYCGEFYPTVKQVAAKYNDQITFQFRNLPLTQIHQNAFAGARAAEAASLQGKFWEMHDLLYANQSAWENSNSVESIFTSYASQLGLNTKQFQSDYASTKVNDTINADAAAFAKLGLPMQTPTFILDGKSVQPSNSVDAFSQLIDNAIKQKQNK